MTPQELTDIAQQHGVDVTKLKVINPEGNFLSAKRIEEKGRNELEASKNLAEVGLSEQAGGYDENGILRSPDDGGHRLEAATLAKNLSPVMTTIAAIQKIEEQPGGAIAQKERENLGRLLDHYKNAEDRFQQADHAFKELRTARYHAAMTEAFTPVLKQQGFTDQEAAVTVEALTKTALETEGNLVNHPEIAAQYAGQLQASFQASSFDYSNYKADATKIENVVCKAFNARMTQELDGELKIKGDTPNFRARYADQFAAEAAVNAGMTQQPMKLPHERMEAKNAYHMGGTFQAAAQMGDMQQAQASETYKVNASVPLNDDGQTVAFAKRGIGAKTAELREAKDEVGLFKSQFKDSEQIGTMAPLYGTVDQVGEVDSLNPDGKRAVLGGQVETLPARSVASSAVNEALGMKSIAKETIGIDGKGQVVGLSVAAAGSPMLRRPEGGDSHEAFLAIDYSDPEIQKGLYDLEAQDYITGQIDRHPGNIFVDPYTKQVTGIDNDLAFPTVDRNQMVAANGGVACKAAQGMPTFLHEDTATKIEAMRPEDLRQSLQNLNLPGQVPGLEAAAIDGAVQRLEQLQEEIKTMRAEGRVVSEFKPEHYQQARADQLKLANGDDIGNQGNYAIPRTSYVGSAVLLEARTAALNNNQREDYRVHNERTLLKATDVPETKHDDLTVAYKEALETAKQDLAQNPHKISDMRLGAAVVQGQQQKEALETKLALQTQEVDSLASTYRAIQRTPMSSNDKRLGQSKEALMVAQDERRETLQQLGQVKKDLNNSLNKAVEPMKPQIHRAAGIDTLQKQLDVARAEVQLNQQKVNSIQGGGIMGNHRIAAVQAGLNDAEEKQRLAQEKLTQFTQETAFAEAPARNTVGEALGRARSNSATKIQPSASLDGPEEDNGAKKNSTRAMLGQHRNNQAKGSSVDVSQPRVRSNSLG